ncbi:sigma-70 family RNA polymerase sigma factor [Bradyrhizobium sp. dw_411]|uniref:sigma-70 family RNA polymerase sigma factor n=1 Tax=Bradyrhizobium sp. dw_411 TaxID=2720082 RepID=UPI00201CA89D|nr:sigma-70 family RNA polymerase sigma factor [Bradyrhizobium sp. dw_411]
MLATVPSLRRNRSAASAATDDPWGDLMAAAQLGNAGAYTRLLTEVDGWLRRYYARRLPVSMVEDAAQDTLLTLHTRRHTYEPGRPFKAWLAGIARYKWIDRLRALDRDPAGHGAEDISEDIAIDDHGPAVMSALLLHELLNQLKPAQSEVIRLVKLEGLSIEEAAERTGQSASLVKVNMHRGLTRLSHIVATDVT